MRHVLTCHVKYVVDSLKVINSS